MKIKSTIKLLLLSFAKIQTNRHWSFLRQLFVKSLVFQVKIDQFLRKKKLP